MEPFVGQISAVAFDFAPNGWALCDGQLMSIAQYPALFAVLGTTFGGDGLTTFALPDLRGRAPLHFDAMRPLGISGGAETVALDVDQIPGHAHVPNAVAAQGTQTSPAGGIWAASTGGDLQFSTEPTNTVMAQDALGPGGGDQPHDNMPPMTVLNFIIALTELPLSTPAGASPR